MLNLPTPPLGPERRGKEKISNEERIRRRLLRINSVTPVRIYKDLLANKKLIMAENRKQSGIYLWHCLIDNKFYIGRSVNLSSRLGSYFSFKELVRPFLRGQNSEIHLAILRFDYIHFELRILEYCDKAEVEAREIHYIETLKPSLNLIRTSSGRVFMGEEQKKKQSLAMTGRTLSTEHKANISQALLGTKKIYPSTYHHNSKAVVVTNTVTGEEINYPSISEAARRLGCSQRNASKAIKTGHNLLKIYHIRYMVPPSS